jgi:archaellum component FlaC
VLPTRVLACLFISDQLNKVDARFDQVDKRFTKIDEVIERLAISTQQEFTRIGERIDSLDGGLTPRPPR